MPNCIKSPRDVTAGSAVGDHLAGVINDAIDAAPGKPFVSVGYGDLGTVVDDDVGRVELSNACNSAGWLANWHDSKRELLLYPR